MLVRDRILLFMQQLPFFSSRGFKYHTSKAIQIQPENVPFAAVYFIEETGLPSGDANEGDIRFRTTARYGISVMIQNNDSAAAELILDAAFFAITSMFKNPDLYNWDGGADEAKIQAFIRGARSHQFGNIGQTNELPVAELRYDLTVDLGEILYDPPVTDDFITFHVETRYPGGTDTSEIQQIVAQYDIPQGIQHKLSGRLLIKVNADVVHP
jgi:hypothetical protein